VHDERLEVVGEASGGGGVAGTFEPVDQALEALVAVALACGVVEWLPVGLAARSRSRSGSFASRLRRR
jgi:hypothetical protein